jgi:hypothetical protein
VLTNASPIGVPEALSLSFFDLVQSGTVKNDYLTPLGRLFQEMGKPTYGTLVDYAKPPAQRSPALPSEAYVGAYRNDYFGEIAIVLQQGKLFLQLGPNKTLFPLQHYNRDVFSYQPVGENAFGLSAVTFTIGADQKASHVVIENLNLEKQGRFSRIVAR